MDAVSEIFCPQCGYDLQGIDSARCPECGHEIDRTGMAQSQLPWAFRHEMGWWRAYWRTVWIGTWRIRQLAMEVARPVDRRAANRFATITGLLAGLPLAVASVVVIVREGGAVVFLDAV